MNWLLAVWAGVRDGFICIGGKRMKFFSEHEVRKLIEETDIHDGIRGTADEYLSIMKGIELPDKHGRLIDAEELCKNFTGECWENLCAYVSEAPTVLEASDKTETPGKAYICPHYQGACGLDEDIFCYCSRHYEMCDKYREASE